MKKVDFLKQFKSLLPDQLNDTSIDLNDIETTTLIFIGRTISQMEDEAQTYFDRSSGKFDDMLIDIVAEKYKIEW
jgi:hypothetical protein